VTAGGVVTGVGAGSATITATSEGKAGTAAITVTAAPVGSVTVSPAPATVVGTQTVQLTATVKDQNGVVVTDRPVSWSTNNATVGAVSATGLVAGVNTTGSAINVIITATSETKSGSSTVSVTPDPVATVTLPAQPQVRKGSNLTLSVTLLDALGRTLSGRTVTWLSNNTAVATVNSSGVVHGVVEGTAVITATSEGKSGTTTVTVTK
jgi:uncharacterized protein YjdB